MKSSEADARRWLRQAENDLDFARLALREGFFAQACFMAHQVAEKALKALAYHRGDRYVTGHSLLELLSSLEPAHPELSGHRELAGLLDQYYLTTRYPDALPGGVPFEAYNRGQGEDAVQGARAIDSGGGQECRWRLTGRTGGVSSQGRRVRLSLRRRTFRCVPPANCVPLWIPRLRLGIVHAPIASGRPEV